MRVIREVENLRGKRVLVRASLDVPLDNERNIVDSFRLDKAIATIAYLKNHDAKVIVIGHLGRDPHESLESVAAYFAERMELQFVNDILGPLVRNTLSSMQNGDVVLLENTRREHGEKANELEFAKELASYADIFVNDGISVAHREHASVTGVAALLPSYAGITFIEELEQLEGAQNPKSPSIFILGGAKFETKQPLVEKFMSVYDHVFVTGALANDFFKTQGHEVGRSLLSNPPVDVRHLLQQEKMLLPIDVTVLTENGEKQVKKPNQVIATDQINDIGPETVEMLRPIISDAEFVLWNGPTGDYTKGFERGSKEVADMIIASGAKSVVGGGDTMALISKYEYHDKYSFCSTAGGAMLEFLQKGTLPAIEAIRNSPNE